MDFSYSYYEFGFSGGWQVCSQSGMVYIGLSWGFEFGFLLLGCSASVGCVTDR